MREETQEIHEEQEKAPVEEEPIGGVGKAIIDGACAMEQAAKSLTATPKDEPTSQLLAHHSKNVSESMKTLVASIRDKTPGQEDCDAMFGKLVVTKW